MARTAKALSKQISLIATAVTRAKYQTIKRISRQLARMSPNDLRTLERLLGKR